MLMTNQLQQAFREHAALIPFVVVNDPDPETTVKNVVALAENGADIVELGLPFSDPVADGPVIQAADQRALAAHPAIAMTDFFAIVKAIRQQTRVSLVFLTYLNLPFQYGYERFCAACQQNGIQGVIIPDLPLEEQGELAPLAAAHELALIPLVAPTTGPKRLQQIAQQATGFIYVVSALGVTGQRETFAGELTTMLEQLRQVTTLPLAIGFGIHTPAQAKALAAQADGVIVGSAMVQLVAQHGSAAPTVLGEFAQTLRQALDEGAKN